jgi:hypothetical protein
VKLWGEDSLQGADAFWLLRRHQHDRVASIHHRNISDDEFDAVRGFKNNQPVPARKPLRKRGCCIGKFAVR